MIFDANNELAAYGRGLPQPLCGDICRVVAGIDATHPEGEFPIRGRDAFFRVMSYATKPADECRIEGHREYIDIQFSLDGAEGIDVFHASGHGSAGSYDEDADIEFYGNDLALLASTVNLPGYFTLLFPHDLHRPRKRITGVKHVKKAVIKIRKDTFFFRERP